MSLDTLREYVYEYITLIGLPKKQVQVELFQVKRSIEVYMMQNAGENLYIFADPNRNADADVIIVRFDHMSEKVFINRRKVN